MAVRIVCDRCGIEIIGRARGEEQIFQENRPEHNVSVHATTHYFDEKERKWQTGDLCRSCVCAVVVADTKEAGNG